MSILTGTGEEPAWSLGVLPAHGQPVMITNTGWKAVAIAGSTAQNYPASLNVNSPRISSPADSSTTLLLNFVGLQTPLTVNSLTVERNTAFTMHLSALQLTGPTGVGMSIGGQINQNDSSTVTGNQFDVGSIGPA